MKTSTNKNFHKKTASLFRILGQPARLRILFAIGSGETCVCHLEAMLGMRQAYISQQLMALRDAGLVSTRREGKFIYYRLQDLELLDLLADAARLSGTGLPEIKLKVIQEECACPTCSP